MSGIMDDYYTEIDSLKNNCKILKNIDPKNEYLQLIVFDRYGEILIKPEFWKKFGPKDRNIPHYNLHTLANANNQLENAVKEAKKKSLVSKID